MRRKKANGVKVGVSTFQNRPEKAECPIHFVTVVKGHGRPFPMVTLGQGRLPSWLHTEKTVVAAQV